MNGMMLVVALAWLAVGGPASALTKGCMKGVAEGPGPELVQTAERPLVYLEQIATPQPRSRPSPPAARRVELKVLILSATDDPAEDPGVELAVLALRGFSLPFEHRALTRSGVRVSEAALGLERQPDLGGYYAIVLTSGQLAFKGRDGGWMSALTPEQWRELESYERRFGARRVSLYSYPAPELGVTLAGEAGSAATSVGLTPDAVPFATGVNPSVAAPLSYSWQYPAMVLAPTPAVQAKSLMHFGAADARAERRIAAALSTFSDGRGQLSLFFAQSPSSIASLAIAPVWVHWMSRGLYVGERRIHLNTQIDDIFLETDLWSPDGQDNPEDRSRVFRVSLDDIQAFFAWRRQVAQRLPVGSRFRAEFAFNGRGVWERGGYGDAIFRLFRENHGEFFWVNHTYSHVNLDHVGTRRAIREVDTNAAFAADLFADDDADFSPAALVTPKISGLSNGPVLTGLHQSGIRSIIGDNSIPAHRGAHPFVGLLTTVERNGFAGMLVIPRLPTEIYYDVSRPEESISEYNFRYHAYWGRDLGFSELIGVEAHRVTRGLINYQFIPHMFHQANLRNFPTADGRRTSLYATWVEAVLDELTKYSTLPVLSERMDDLARIYADRMRLEACAPRAIVALEGSVATAIEVTSTGACMIPISTTALTSIRDASEPPRPVASETYGPDRTTYVSAATGVETKLLLTPSLRWD